jgi:hypothetical protein
MYRYLRPDHGDRAAKKYHQGTNGKTEQPLVTRLPETNPPASPVRRLFSLTHTAPFPSLHMIASVQKYRKGRCMPATPVYPFWQVWHILREQISTAPRQRRQAQPASRKA